MIRKLFALLLILFLLTGPAPRGVARDGLEGRAAIVLAKREAAAAAALSEEKQVVQSLWPVLRKLPADKRPRVALVLGGGGARGLAHIGVLKVLEQEKVPVDLVVGTSVGALIGALYTAGLSMDKIERMGEEAGWDKLTDFSSSTMVKLLISDELVSTKKMQDYVGQHIGNKKFGELEKDFACVAVDLKTGEQIVLREGNVALAARASATMPGLFQPVEYRHRLLIDGGVLDNTPTNIARLLDADIILCVNVPADFAKHNVSNVLTTLTQALYIQGELISQESLKLADIVIEPKVGHISALELWRSRECIEAGVAATRQAMEKIRRILVTRTFKTWTAPEKEKDL